MTHSDLAATLSCNPRCLSPLKDSWHKDLATSHFCKALGALRRQPLHAIPPRAAIFYQKADFFLSSLSLSCSLSFLISIHARTGRTTNYLRSISGNAYGTVFSSTFNTADAHNKVSREWPTRSFAFARFYTLVEPSFFHLTLRMCPFTCSKLEYDVFRIFSHEDSRTFLEMTSHSSRAEAKYITKKSPCVSLIVPTINACYI